jgi:hypothetical protein
VLRSCLPDLVFVQIQFRERGVGLQGLAQVLRSCIPDSVVAQIEGGERGVGLQGLAQVLRSCLHDEFAVQIQFGENVVSERAEEAVKIHFFFFFLVEEFFLQEISSAETRVFKSALMNSQRTSFFFSVSHPGMYFGDNQSLQSTWEGRSCEGDQTNVFRLARHCDFTEQL